MAWCSNSYCVKPTGLTLGHMVKCDHNNMVIIIHLLQQKPFLTVGIQYFDVIFNMTRKK